MGGLSRTLPSPAGRRAPFEAASRLVALARNRESAARRRNPFPPFLHLIGNMFLCAAAHRLLADDRDGVFLPLFIAVQCLLGILITLSFIGRTGAEIVRKTRLYPGSASAGYYFLVAASLRRPELLLFAAVGCVFPAFVYGGGATAAAGIVAASALPFLTAQILCCAAAAKMTGSDRPLTGIVLLTVLAAASALASVFIFRTGALASAIPLAGWAATAVTSFVSGRSADGLARLSYLAIVLVSVVAVFRK